MAFKGVTASSEGQNWRAVFGIQSSSNGTNDSNTISTQYSPCIFQYTSLLESLESLGNIENKEKEVKSFVMTPEEAAALAIEGGL